MSDLRHLLAPYRGELEAEFRRLIPELEGPYRQLYGMVYYHLGWADASLEPARPQGASTGKRVRSGLCLMAADAVGGSRRQVLPAAAAVEFLHEFSLIHDDIEDRDRERRHRPTLWTIWGEAQAINAGDTLFALAHLALNEISARGVPAAIAVEAYRRFNMTTLRLCQGQYLDLDFETHASVTPDEYLQMIEGKTVALLAHAAELGALVGGGTSEQITACYEFGRHLGIGFQIQDDVLGLWGDVTRTGKPVGTDVRQRKKTFPILLALNDPSEHGDRVRTLYAKPSLTDEEVGEVCTLVAETGARREAEQHMRKAYSRSLQALTRLERTASTGDVEPLRRLVHALMERQS